MVEGDGDPDQGQHGCRRHGAKALQQAHEALAVDRLPDVGRHGGHDHQRQRILERKDEGHERQRNRRQSHADGALGDAGNNEGAGHHQHLHERHRVSP